MTRHQYFLVLIIAQLFFAGCSGRSAGPEIESSGAEAIAAKSIKGDENLLRAIKAMEPFFKPMGEPREFDWLASFPEAGQTFEEYINSSPTLPGEKRTKIYLQPIGKFNERQRKILETTAGYMEAYFGLPLKLLPEKQFAEPLSLENYRIHPRWKTRQIKTGYIMQGLLKPALPEDAAALIAFTNEDLYPFSFVFGQAAS